MTRQELTEYCLAWADAAADAPFADGRNTVLRHRSNGKWFALLCELDGRLCINLKCDPMEADFLRRALPGVRPAWHMNKVHWNTVEVDAVPQEILFDMIRKSFELTGNRKGRRKEAGTGRETEGGTDDGPS